MTGADIVTIGEAMILLYGGDTTVPFRLGERQVALGVGFSLTDGTCGLGLSGVTARTKRLKRLLAKVEGR